MKCDGTAVTEDTEDEPDTTSSTIVETESIDKNSNDEVIVLTGRKEDEQYKYDRIQENKEMEQRLREQLKAELRKEQELEDKKKQEMEIQKNKDVFNEVYNKLTSDSKALNEALKTTILETIESQVIKKQQEQISDLQTMLKSSIESNQQTVSEMLP